MQIRREVTVEVANVVNFTVEWSTRHPIPDDEPTTNIMMTGIYTALVTNTDNGCQTTAEVTVGGRCDLLPSPLPRLLNLIA
ncbi:MAG: hypothetical protein R2795_20010 [Saprospiraceae bacterium]